MTDSLYELSAELAIIHDEIISNEGEITDALEKRLDESTLSFNAKVEQIGRWVLNLGGREDAIEKEIARLQAKKKSNQNLQGRLKEYVKMCMEMANKTKMEYGTMTVSIQKNPASCEVKDEKAIPAKYLTIIPETKVVDKKAVLADLKAGVQVEGAELINTKTHLRIR